MEEIKRRIEEIDSGKVQMIPYEEVRRRLAAMLSDASKYHFHPQAWQEVEASEAWYRERDPQVSVRFLSALYDGLESIARWPDRWPTYHHGTRRIILKTRTSCGKTL